MMSKAKQTRLDMFFELTADLEIFKHQIVFWLTRCRKTTFIPAQYYRKTDQTKKSKWWEKFKKQFLETCAREVNDDHISHEFQDANDKHNYTEILQEIKNKIKSQPTERSNRSTNKVAIRQTSSGIQHMIKNNS